MSSIPDRLRPVPARLATESQVIAIVEDFVEQAPLQASDIPSALAKTGILAISIPAEFGGADISNAVVAEAVGKLSAWDPLVAAGLIGHLTALELIRSAGTTEQRRVIYGRVMLGDLFDLALLSQEGERPLLQPSGLSFSLSHAGSATTGGRADWHVVIAGNCNAAEIAVVLPSASLAGQEQSSALAVSPDNVLELGAGAVGLAELMRELLLAAAYLGRNGTVSKGGTIERSRVEREILDAVAARVALVIDTIQVDPDSIDLGRVEYLLEALKTSLARSLPEA